MSCQISVIVPAYNVENFIDRCLRSLFSQTLGSEKYQIIVIDDGSTDGTLETLKAFEQNPLVRILRLPRNSGKAEALAAGLGIALVAEGLAERDGVPEQVEDLRRDDHLRRRMARNV